METHRVPALLTLSAWASYETVREFRILDTISRRLSIGANHFKLQIIPPRARQRRGIASVFCRARCHSVSGQIVRQCRRILCRQGKADVPVRANQISSIICQAGLSRVIVKLEINQLQPVPLRSLGQHRIGFAVDMKLPTNRIERFEIVQNPDPGQSVTAPDFPGATF